jgi:arsenate reductase
MKARIYHNPRCSKSRAALALLEERGLELEIIEYLETPPSKTVLRKLLEKLDGRALDLVRTGEPEFKSAITTGRKPTVEEILDLLVATPRLLQRPIVEIGGRARIGRPPERVLELLE